MTASVGTLGAKASVLPTSCCATLDTVAENVSLLEKQDLRLGSCELQWSEDLRHDLQPSTSVVERIEADKVIDNERE